MLVSDKKKTSEANSRFTVEKFIMVGWVDSKAAISCLITGYSIAAECFS